MVVDARKLCRIGARWVPLLLWMTLIFMASDRVPGELPTFGPWDLLVKKAGHMLAYAVLAILARRAVVGGAWPDLWVLAITAVYAASDEFHQVFVPGRNGSVVDLFIDCLGGMMGVLARYYWQTRHH